MKSQLRTILEQGKFEAIPALALSRRRILSRLTSLTYEQESLIAWRACEAMGIAADTIAAENPERVVSHLRQLHWLLSDESGGICWYAPQAMAEIVVRRPRLFADYIPLIVSLLTTMEEEDLGHFRPAVLWAIGRLAPVAQGELEHVMAALGACLESSEAQVRGLAVWCLLQAERRELLEERPQLQQDRELILIYNRGMLEGTTISRLLAQPR